MRHLYSKNVSDQSLEFHLPNGNYAGFVIGYEGTNDTGKTATRDNLGSILFNMDGHPIINCDAELLSYLNDMKGGFSTFDSTIAGAFNCFIYVPCGDFGDRNNSYLITKDQDVYFKLDFTALDTELITGKVTIYGIYRDGIQNYIYNIHQRNVVAGGAGWISDFQTLENISTVLIKNYANIDDIQLMKDEELLFNLSTASALALSNFNNQVEVTSPLIEMDLNTSRDFTELLSKQLHFRYNFSGADTLEQYFTYKTFTPKKAVRANSQNISKGQNKVVAGVTKQLPRVIPIGGIVRIDPDLKPHPAIPGIRQD